MKMSLGKLLAAGRSLVGGAPDAGRYNLSPRNRLPRFGGMKNPFASASAVEASFPAAARPARSEPAQAAPDARTISPHPEPERASADSAGQSANFGPGDSFQTPPGGALPAAKPSPAVGRAPRTRVKAALARAGTFAQRLAAGALACARRGAGWFRRPRKPFIPRFGRPAVQSEFSLDDVKVVRGDLNESDLEFVEPVTSTATVAGPKTPAALSKRGPVPAALKKLTDRILGPVAH